MHIIITFTGVSIKRVIFRLSIENESEKLDYDQLIDQFALQKTIKKLLI
jgi:hypothetical protein